MSDFFDRMLNAGETIAINITFGGAGDSTVLSVPAGKKFVVTYMHLEASATLDLIIKSGSTEITGLMAMTATSIFDAESSGAPILKGRASGDDLVFNSSAAGDVDGWVYYALVDG